MSEIRLIIYVSDLKNLQTTHKKAKKVGIALSITDNNRNPQT